MTDTTVRSVLALVVLVWAGCAPPAAEKEHYDLVVRGGRVMDPESGLDAVRNLGIRNGKIAQISAEPLLGDRTIEATDLVVAPGFIDLHAHGQSEESFGLMVRDGVTAAFELEVGTADVSSWYGQREGGQLLNYGVSIGHIPIRMKVMGDSGTFLPSGPGGSEPATNEQLAEMEGLMETGLQEGAVAVGFGLVYTPAATTDEFESMLRIAAAHGASAHIHVRGGSSLAPPGPPAGLVEAIEGAAATGAALHVVHANSSGGVGLADFLQIIQDARDKGQDVTTEAYPYEAGMTMIESAIFDEWESWEDDRFPTFQWAETGKRLTRESFARYRVQGGGVIIHSRTEEQTRAAMKSPLTMIASDGLLEDGRGHPRTSGTYSKVLGKYVREEGVLTLMAALGRMTIEPARRLEGFVPAMKAKGRLSVGADADITIFDPGTVTDRSTYTDPTLPSAGVPFVLVGGVLVVDDGVLVPGARPGRAIRVQ